MYVVGIPPRDFYSGAENDYQVADTRKAYQRLYAPRFDASRRGQGMLNCCARDQMLLIDENAHRTVRSSSSGGGAGGEVPGIDMYVAMSHRPAH